MTVHSCACVFEVDGAVAVPCAVHERWLKEAQRAFISAASYRERMLLEDVRKSYAEARARLPRDEWEIAALNRVLGVAKLLGAKC